MKKTVSFRKKHTIVKKVVESTKAAENSVMKNSKQSIIKVV